MPVLLFLGLEYVAAIAVCFHGDTRTAMPADEVLIAAFLRSSEIFALVAIRPADGNCHAELVILGIRIHFSKSPIQSRYSEPTCDSFRLQPLPH